MKFTDAAKIQGTRVREDGYLVVDARIARTGVQLYHGSEMGRPDLGVVRVYRDEAEVFSDEAMASFAHRPITNDHPPVAVTADNWKQLAVGQTDGEIKRDGKFLRVPMMVADSATIKLCEAGKIQLSAGYTCDVKWGAGTTADGQVYDASQTNIRCNHVAIVQAGRAGADCRIGDSAEAWGAAPITVAQDKEIHMTLRTILVDGLSVETTAAGEQAINKLNDTIRTLKSTTSDAATAHSTAMAAKDAEMSKLQAKLDDAQSKVPDAAAISKLVADRVSLEAVAGKLAKDVKPTGLTDKELKLAVLKAKLGDKLPKDKVDDQAYIDARFDIMAEDANGSTDTFRQARMGDGQPNRGGQSQINLSDAEAVRQKAFDELVQHDQSAYMGATVKQ